MHVAGMGGKYFNILATGTVTLVCALKSGAQSAKGVFDMSQGVLLL